MSDSNADYLFYLAKHRLPVVDRAEGVRIWDRDGKEYIDGCSGAVISNIGYGRERVNRVVAEQAAKTFFAYRLHFENQPAMDLAKALVDRSASHLNRVYYVSGGSEAVESAIKLCRQYFYARGEGSRYQFIARTPSYHGATLGALALTSYAPLETPFRPMMVRNPKIPAPYCYRCAYHLTYPSCNLACARALEKAILEEGPQNVAGFVAEPVGGASTGAVVPPDDYFGIISETCKKYGVMLILDEVMTGFGRTGRMFGYEHWGVEADIVALSKGMASGYYPLGAVLARQNIVEAVMASGGFQHGHTYAGNPMACAVGLEVLNIIVEEDLPGNAARVGEVLKAGLTRLAEKHPVIGQVRGRGLLLALELVADRETKKPLPPEQNGAQTLMEIAFEEGLIIYPRRSINGLSGDHCLVSPPLVITEAETSELLDRLDRALVRFTKG